MREEIERRTAAGETVGVMDQMRIVKTTLGRMHKARLIWHYLI